jgi:hypothetical protein
MIKKVFHTTLALLMILTVTGITINLHYCQDHLYDLALFSPAHSCCEEGGTGHCHMTEGISSMDHCVDSSIHVEPTGEYLGSFPEIGLTAAFAIDLFQIPQATIYTGSVAKAARLETFWYQEPPPFHEVDLAVIQTFLI